MPQWFAPSFSARFSNHVQSNTTLNTLCCAPGTHFASYDDADCLALPRLRLSWQQLVIEKRQRFFQMRREDLL